MELKCSNNETVLRSFDCGKSKIGNVGLTVTTQRVIATTSGKTQFIKKEIPLESVKAVNFSCGIGHKPVWQIVLGIFCIILTIGFVAFGIIDVPVEELIGIAMPKALCFVIAIVFLVLAILLLKRINSICLSITQMIKKGGRQRRKISSSKKVGLGPGLAIILIIAALGYFVFSLINPEIGAPTLGTLLIIVVHLVVGVLIVWFLGGAKELNNAQTQEDVETGMRKHKAFGKVVASLLTITTLVYTIADIIIMSENRATVNGAKDNVENIVLTAFMWILLIIIWINVSKKGAGKSMIGAATAKTFELNLDMKSARILASEIGAAILDAKYQAQKQLDYPTVEQPIVEEQTTEQDDQDKTE